MGEDINHEFDEFVDEPQGEGGRSENANGSGKSDQVGYGNAPTETPDVAPLDLFNASQWEGKPIVPRRWTVNQRIPAGEPGLYTGDGGTGKTLTAQQLTVAIVAELPDWLGAAVEMHGPAIFFSPEESLDEFHRRYDAIIVSRKLSFKDLRHLHVFSHRRQDAVLGKPKSRNGPIEPTPLFRRLEKSLEIIRPAFIAIENAANVFGGDEIDRMQTTAFMNMLGGLGDISGASVMLLQHPSLTGLSSGSGTSGSTGWRNTGRWAMNLIITKGEDGQPDRDMRELEVKKNNYGQFGEKIKIRWNNGVFVPVGAMPDHMVVVDAERVFLECLDAARASGRNVSSTSTAPTFAPAQFAKTERGKAIGKKNLANAMERLFVSKKILVAPNPDVKPSKATPVILRAVGPEGGKNATEGAP